MTIHFFSSGPIEQVSGGYLYNRYLIDYLRSAGKTVTYHSAPDSDVKFKGGDDAIVDSLAVGQMSSRLLALRRKPILLLHLLPYRFSSLYGEQVIDAEDMRAIYRKSCVVVTGDTSYAELASDCSIELVKIEPAVSERWLQKNKYSETAQELLYVGNYVAGKGHHRLVDVLSGLVHTEWTLRMYGNQLLDPDCFESIGRKVKEYGLSDRIILFPAVSHEEINRKMVESDLLVNLSQYESYSMVTAEAIASGLPVLSYRTGSINGFVDSGLVRYIDDAPRNAESALEDLICNPGDYSQLRRTENWQKRTWRDVGLEFSLLLGRN